MFLVFSLIVLSLNTLFFFFNDTATTEIYTLSLHDALPISRTPTRGAITTTGPIRVSHRARVAITDRKSTRLNSSHSQISYAVFCLKKKKKQTHMLYLTHDKNASILHRDLDKQLHMIRLLST